MANRRFNPREIQIRRVNFFPQDIDREPHDPEDLVVKDDVQIVLANLFGQSASGGRSIDAYDFGALKTASYGSGYTYYATISGTAPSSYSATHQLAAASGYYHRFDLLIESQEALIRFYLDATQSWGGDIPLPTGYHSIEISSSKVQIMKRGATAGTYTIVAYQ